MADRISSARPSERCQGWRVRLGITRLSGERIDAMSAHERASACARMRAYPFSDRYKLIADYIAKVSEREVLACDIINTNSSQSQ